MENDGKDFERNFSINIELQKTCYFKGEPLKGNIIIKPKNNINKKLLQCPITSNVTLEEIHNYKLTNLSYDTNEDIILFKYPMNIPKFQENDIINGMIVPFEFQIPHNSYPSLLIDRSTFVRHILIFEFSPIEEKRSTFIIIKNSRYFSDFNELYKSPVEENFITTKHKYALLNMGEMGCSVKLQKNAFTYNESIPFQIDIDFSNLKIKIQKIYISIYFILAKNSKNHKQVKLQNQKTIFSKEISLLDLKDKAHLEDVIILSKENPGQIYKQLDLDKTNNSNKFNNVLLLPACYEGLITCKYYLKVTFETDTLFSTNESLEIPLDFYASENEEENEINNLNQIVEKPMPMSSNNFSKIIDFDKIDNSNQKKQNTLKNKIFSSFNFFNLFNKGNSNQENPETNNNINKNNNLNNSINQNNNINNNNINNNINDINNINKEIITPERNEIESFDAPPIIYSEIKFNDNDK